MVKRLIHSGENELADFGNVAPIRQHLLSRRHDLIGGNIISHLQEDRSFHRIGEGMKRGKRLNIRPLLKVNRRAFFGRRREHGRVDNGLVGVFNFWVFHVQCPRIGNHAGKRRSCGRFRAAQIDLIVFGAGTTREIARHGTQADSPGGRRLPHADAAVAAGLMDAATGLNQFSQESRLRQVFQDLAGSGIDVERNPVVHLLAVHDQRGDSEIPQCGLADEPIMA